MAAGLRFAGLARIRSRRTAILRCPETAETKQTDKFFQPTSAGGGFATTAVNGIALSIFATDPQSYWLGAYVNGNPPPKHLWLVHERG